MHLIGDESDKRNTQIRSLIKQADKIQDELEWTRENLSQVKPGFVMDPNVEQQPPNLKQPSHHPSDHELKSVTYHSSKSKLPKSEKTIQKASHHSRQAFDAQIEERKYDHDHQDPRPDEKSVYNTPELIKSNTPEEEIQLKESSSVNMSPELKNYTSMNAETQSAHTSDKNPRETNYHRASSVHAVYEGTSNLKGSASSERSRRPSSHTLGDSGFSDQQATGLPPLPASDQREPIAEASTPEVKTQDFAKKSLHSRLGKPIPRYKHADDQVPEAEEETEFF